MDLVYTIGMRLIIEHIKKKKKSERQTGAGTPEVKIKKKIKFSWLKDFFFEGKSNQNEN